MCVHFPQSRNVTTKSFIPPILVRMRDDNALAATACKNYRLKEMFCKMISKCGRISGRQPAVQVAD